VKIDVAMLSNLVKSMIDDDQDDEAQDIPLPNVKSEVLAKIIEFCNHNVEEPMKEIEKVLLIFILIILIVIIIIIIIKFRHQQPLKSANMEEVVQEWYAKFVTVEQETLFELILAANYMDIKPLLDLSCATGNTYYYYYYYY
jgi:S-phase kinase-associated protein 1